MFKTRHLFQARSLTILVLAAAGPLALCGCSTTPKPQDRAKVVNDSRTTVAWFERNVSGLRAQLDASAGYVSFPGIGQYGILISGSKFGRGVVFDRSGEQLGWAYINTLTAGLQLGAQGYMMLVVIQDDATMQNFQQNKLSGDVSATAVAASEGGSRTASFSNGVAVYQGRPKGLMAGVSVGLEYIRYAALGAEQEDEATGS